MTNQPTLIADEFVVINEHFHGADIEYSGRKVYTGTQNWFLSAKEKCDRMLPDGYKLKELHVMQSETDGKWCESGNPECSPQGTKAWCRAVVIDDKGEEKTGAWVFDYSYSASNCAYYCASNCALYALSVSDFRSALLSSF